MRGLAKYIHLHKNWPAFTWDNDKLISILSSVRHKQGKLHGELKGLGFQLREEATLETLTQDVIKSSEIEGEKLPADQVRSSVAKRLGIEIAGEITPSRHVDGVVEMMLDATQKYEQKLTKKRLFAWHASLFPTAQNGMLKIRFGRWRNDSSGPMQVVSGPLGKEKVHFEAPDASKLEEEMNKFIQWFNEDDQLDPVLKAAIAQLWFVTIHPFDDGNEGLPERLPTCS